MGRFNLLEHGPLSRNMFHENNVEYCERRGGCLGGPGPLDNLSLSTLNKPFLGTCLALTTKSEPRLAYPETDRLSNVIKP